MIRKQLLKGGAVMGMQQVICSGSSFVRTLIVARLVDRTDFGIAATLGMTVALLDMTSDLNAGTLLIQSKDGNEPELQASAQSVGLIRGMGCAAILLAIAYPAAALFSVPQATWAFLCLAMYPLFRAFAHLDTSRLQREMRFKPSAQVEVVSQLVSLLAAWPLAWWLRDYSALLWLMLLQAAVSTAATHWVAERRYRLAWNRTYIRQLLQFGWPLIINGMLMFAIMQGERLVIGSSKQLFPASSYTMADLGDFSVALTLTMTGVAALTKIAVTLMLPALAAVQSDQERFGKRYLMTAQVLCVGGACVALLFILAGKPLVIAFYGSQYVLAGRYIGWLGAAQAVRTVRMSVVLAALAKGDTRNTMMANLARSSGLLGCVAAAALGADLQWVAISALGGELVGWGVSTIMVHRRQQLSLEQCLGPSLIVALALAAASVAYVGGFGSLGLFASLGAVFAGVAMLLIVWVITVPNVRHEVRASVLLIRARGVASGH